MKLLMYVAGGLGALIAATFLLLLGPSPDSNPFILAVFFVLYAIAPLGGFWMMYMSIRYEKKPWPKILLALIPFTFLWYYFERRSHGSGFRDSPT
jgi:hypothetical protein